MKEFIKQHFIDNNIILDKFMPIGIRNNANFEYDRFNDYLMFLYEDELSVAKGTTDPGVYYTSNPLSRNGAFHLNLGYHKNIWRLRKHRGKYLALCDDSLTSNVSGWRDGNKNHRHDIEEILDIGNFGVNWHYSNNSDLINYASAGCQVTNNIKFFNKSIECAIASEQELFSYYLFDISEIPVNLIVDIDKMIREGIYA